MMADNDDDLGAVVSSLVGRHVTTSEIIDAVGVSRSGYYVSRNAGRLVTADNVLALADAFGLNPVDLLVRFGLLGADTAVEYVRGLGGQDPKSRSRRLRRRSDAPPL